MIKLRANHVLLELNSTKDKILSSNCIIVCVYVLCVFYSSKWIGCLDWVGLNGIIYDYVLSVPDGTAT